MKINKKNRIGKKFLSLFLAFLMVCNFVFIDSRIVLAEETENIQTEQTLEETEDTPTEPAEEETVNIPTEQTSEETQVIAEADNDEQTGEGTENEGEEVIAIESLTLSAQEVRLQKEGENNTCELTVTISPETVENADLVWTSSDETIAIVDENGLVTAVANGIAEITVTAEEISASCTVYVGTPVFFASEQDITLKVSDYVTEIVTEPYSKTEEVEEEDPSTEEETITTEDAENTDTETGEETVTESGWVACVDPGAYTYTATGDGYYGSTCAFTVSEEGKVSYTTEWTVSTIEEFGLDQMLDEETGTFYIELETFTKSNNKGAWDGTTLDVSWFDPENTEHHIKTPEQFAGLAAIVNGIYNDEITTIIDTNGTYTPEEYAELEGAKIVAGCSALTSTSGPKGNNQVTSTDYYYNALAYDFEGMTVYLDADLDMGGHQDANGDWTGARYMPIGGQYQMYYVKKGIADGFSHLGSSFNGTLDGQGHIVYNIYCDRYSVTNYGDSSTIGLIGRLGIHDNDYDTWKEVGDDGGNYPAVNPTVRNVAVAGYVYGRRSVGGIVGKIGQTTASELYDSSIGGIIENCINFATVNNTDAKGCGGIVGAGWNSGMVRNCVNFGSVSSTYRNPTGGIVGSNEVSIVNCYNIGKISASADSFAMAIGTNNSGGTDIRNCYWLTGSAPGGGYYNNGSDNNLTTEVESLSEMKTEDFLSLLSGTGRGWEFADETNAIYTYLENAGAKGLPVPRIFTSQTTAKVTSFTKESDVSKLDYTSGERFDTTGLEVWATWSDGTQELMEDFVISIDGEVINRELTTDDNGKEVVVTISAEGNSVSYKYTITVIEEQLDSLEVYEEPENRLYNEGDEFDPTGLKVKINYTNGKSDIAVYQDGSFVDSEDTTITYDIKLTPSAGTALDYATWNEKSAVVEYTYKNITKEASTKVLTVISKEGIPTYENGIYLVSTAAELQWVSEQVNMGIDTDICVKLTADINLDQTYTPIGTAADPYCGTFDGDGHSVTLNLAVESDGYGGLFGYANAASIKNVTAKGSVTGGKYVAGIVGYVQDSTIENCINLAQVTGASVGIYESYLGGIAGYIQGTQISKCGNEADIEGCVGSKSGGIVGHINSSSNGPSIVDNCYNIGNIISTNAAGGIVGTSANIVCSITNCYNWGTVTGLGSYKTSAVGGIVGRTYANTVVANVYNVGNIVVTGNTSYAGAIGGFLAGTVNNYFWTEDCAVENAYIDGSGTANQEGLCTLEELTENVLALADGEVYKEFTDDSENVYPPILLWQTNEESDEEVLENPFTDVSADIYYYNPVLWAYYNNITTGRTATTFEPDASCTRAQVVTFLWRANGEPEPETTENPFTDISKDKFYYKAVLWAVENGITNGKTDTTFEPDTSCTRAQVVTFLWRANGEPEPKSMQTDFTDINENKFYYKAVLWAVENGITTGRTSTTFEPDTSCTRAQVVTFLYRAQ